MCALYSLVLLGPILPYVAFKVNQKYIAQKLCMNRSRPELHCDGQCVLAKQLRQAEQPQPGDPPVIQYVPVYLPPPQGRTEIAPPATYATSFIKKQQLMVPQWVGTIVAPPPQCV